MKRKNVLTYLGLCFIMLVFSINISFSYEKTISITNSNLFGGHIGAIASIKCRVKVTDKYTIDCSLSSALFNDSGASYEITENFKYLTNIAVQLDWGSSRFSPSHEKAIMNIDLAKDDVLTGVLLEMKNQIPQDQKLLDAIEKYFPIKIYQNNSEYNLLLNQATELNRQQGEKEKLENNLIKEKEIYTSNMNHIYHQVKDGKLLKYSDGNLSLTNFDDLWNLMVDDKFGTLDIPENANELQKKKLENNNEVIKLQTFTNLSRFIIQSIISDDIIFDKMETVYVLKSNSSNRVYKKALQQAQATEPQRHESWDSYSENEKKRLINWAANEFINEYPFEFGKTNDYTTNYILHSGEVEINNLPENVILKYSYGTRFAISGSPNVIWDSYNNKKYLNFDYKTLKLFVEDSNK